MNPLNPIFKLLGREQIEIGQVWLSDSDNPFDEKEHTFRVIDIRKGYVKYLFDEKIESSQLASMFRLSKKLSK